MRNLYKRIAFAIENQIIQKNYQGGRKLPSIRELCEKYHCSKTTAVKAYDTLKNKHMVYSVPQSGYYIVEQSLRNEEIDHSVVDFSTGNPLIGAVHIPDLKHCLDRAVDLSNNYSIRRDLHGTGSLRKLLPHYLQTFQVFTSVKNVFITLGIQQMLNLLTHMPFPNGNKTVLIEQPTYRFFMESLKRSGSSVLGIKRTCHGLDLDELEFLFKTKKIKFFYTVPRNHNPLGTTYPAVQRKSIAELAARHHVYIVEDDYFGDVVNDARYDPIYAYGDHYHHIYLKSFSKIIPWFRIGIAVIPTHLLPVFEKETWYSYYQSYFSASLVSQATLDMYIRSKLLAKHAYEIGKELNIRLARLQKCLEDLREYGIEHPGITSGFYTYLRFPNIVDEERLAHELRKKGIFISRGTLYYLDRSFYEKGIRISISRTNAKDIERGCEIIGLVVKSLTARG
ncbi:hypothetical protein P22_1634 [Propionispora sp. 2/2-37]|uniref:aminotransferase-like domain-containing protein n=1 Tax=Propionispora sp. 2/2-37 TaxID=1677858 RepID=UPI0006BB62C2|nr:PLP-dependent aminotransferase family protein [Propionispora sp. 2/2-37]CUH95563.1 hypothetical protein P22_1634 [Propionispora sp. 2/2-37]